MASAPQTLAQARPDLVAEYDRERNPRGPHELWRSSTDYVWWRCAVCPDDHRWRSSPNLRVYQAQGCPWCEGRLDYRPPEPGHSLADTHPQLAEELRKPTYGKLLDAALGWEHPLAEPARLIDTRFSGWCEWRCCAREHHRFWAKLEHRLSGERISPCARWAPLLAQHEPGAVIRRPEACFAASQEEQMLREALEAHPLGQGLAQPDSEVMVARWWYASHAVAPDLVWPQQRLAVEMDGAGPRSNHATPQGQVHDALKRQLLEEVGWRLLRLRRAPLPCLHPDDILVHERAGPQRMIALLEQHLGLGED